MSGSTRAQAAPDTQPRELDDLFGVDVDAELRKLCARSFRSQQHYPVEIVRSALARGADQVRVEIRRDRVEVEDDGAGIGGAALAALRTLLDPGAAAETRQAALPELERDTAIGLLAAWAPSPHLVVIDSAGGGRVEIRRGRTPSARASTRQRGTRVSVFRRGGHLSGERQILRELCRLARAEIRVDGELISRRSGAAEALLWEPLPTQSPAVDGWVALPWEGDLCRVWQLHHGVRQRQWALPPIAGMVFELVVEGTDPASEQLLHQAATVVQDLYRRLVARYRELDEAARDRVDELLFLAHRHRGDQALPLDYAPFTILDDDRGHSLAELRALAARGPVLALRRGEEPSRYDLGTGPVLLLSPRQWEFLSQRVGLALVPPPLRPGRVSWLRRGARQLWRRLLRALHARYRAAQVVPPDRLTLEERALLAALEGALGQGHFALSRVAPAMPISVTMSELRRRVPSVLQRAAREDRAILVLSRAHPLVRSAVAAYTRDPRTLFIALPALVDGEDGWSTSAWSSLAPR